MPSTTSKYPHGVQRVTRDTPVEDIFWLLKRDGGVVVTNFLDRATVEQTNSEIAHRLEADKPWSGSFFPGETRRATAMNTYAPTFTKTQLMDPIYQAVVRHFLTTTNTFWWGNEQKKSVSLPQISATTGIQIGPGAPDQEIHRDDYIHHQVHTEISEWVDDRDLNTRETAVGLFVAGSRATKANGATRFIPGSHLWGNEHKPIETDANTFRAELEVGDAFLMLGSCYHGGSANKTADQSRLVYATFCTRGFLRQEENQYLIISPDSLKKHDRKTQRVLGWAISEPYLGWVDFQDPLKLVYPEEFASSAPTDLASGQNKYN
ncbi:phytanoyl-CoA dioxygenase [Rhizodiscina lignyota]|uniref:Phytanoyl-CoA dioxygenase n=1 Tax=Rhizodiscina lignyota TaxID=1504668 RepID=A0A9P4M383_9PEZI|nr:phytanoyl-CoA dioxygenase [Rhizodiscina lignyota]